MTALLLCLLIEKVKVSENKMHLNFGLSIHPTANIEWNMFVLIKHQIYYSFITSY